MEREQNKTDSDDLAEIWRSAERRRAEDIGAWLGHFFALWKRFKASGVEASYPQSEAGTWVKPSALE
jgi:hypothetical protein